MKAKGVLKGITIGIFCSIFIPYLFNRVGNTLAGGHINYWGESWLYIAFSIPMILSMVILGYYLSTQKNIPNKKMWWISFFVALIVSLFTGTLGILISEMILSGNVNTFNFEDSMIWGVIYSIVFLPLTIPTGKLILNSLHYWIHKSAI